MRNTLRQHIWGWAVMAALLLSACDDSGDNPFDNPDLQPPIDTTLIPDADPQSLVGLHQRIFGPQCANSGCHDGNFEPDFRTIESTYNSLVFHPVTKNTVPASYDFRVRPGSLTESILWLRLNEDIDGQSGIMPLDAYYDPESEWNANKAEHLANISAWIMDGAKDMFGNPTTAAGLQPGIKGIYAEADGSPCAFSQRILVPQGTQQLSVYFAFTDGATPASQLTGGEVRMAPDQFQSFDTISVGIPLQLLAAPIVRNDFFGNSAEYRHHVTFSPAQYPASGAVYMRVFIQDPLLPDTTQIPQDASLMHIKRYFSWQVVN
jgi:hypothetical protein